MIVGVGLDMLDVVRMERPMHSAHFMERVFSEYERGYIGSRGAATAAGIFCAKEAFAKAAGDGLNMPLWDVEISHDNRGQPHIVLHGSAAQRFADTNINVSITHTAAVAAAVVTIERG